MRKILSIFLVMVLCVMLFGCNTDFSNCTSINIRCGTIKVPENWDVSYAENLMYFYSDNANDKKNIYIFQSNSFSEFKDDSSYTAGIVETNAFSSQFQSLYTISSNVISNGAVYGEAMVSVDGTEQKMRFLDFGSEKNEILLFVSSDNVNDETLMQIAESFEST
ncbi:MAG TPA: hypothetical protein OIM33_08100 [Ruminococcus bromii]|nr:hypothetical protein [Ruminococcus bromii]HJI87160.1 hypothetical protein [Ruminococcus bromii]